MLWNFAVFGAPGFGLAGTRADGLIPHYNKKMRFIVCWISVLSIALNMILIPTD